MGATMTSSPWVPLVLMAPSVGPTTVAGLPWHVTSWAWASEATATLSGAATTSAARKYLTVRGTPAKGGWFTPVPAAATGLVFCAPRAPEGGTP